MVTRAGQVPLRAPYRCMFNLHPCQGILALGVLQDARKSHVPVRFDLFGQIDSSVSG